MSDLSKYKDAIDDIDKTDEPTNLIDKIIPKKLQKYKTFIIIFALVLLILLVWSPKFIKKKDDNAKMILDIGKLLKWWIVISISGIAGYYGYKFYKSSRHGSPDSIGVCSKCGN